METKKRREKKAQDLRIWGKNSSVRLATFALGFSIVISACSDHQPNKPVVSKSANNVKTLSVSKKTDPTVEPSDSGEKKDTLKQTSLQRSKREPAVTPPPPAPIDPWRNPEPTPNPTPLPIHLPPPLRLYEPSQLQVEDPIIDIPDVEAQFPGGIAEMVKWINENMNYPEIAIENEVQGKVYVSFVIEKDGSISNVEVLKGVSKELDIEAKRLIRSMPKWTPGELAGKIVRSRYRIPVFFQLH